MPQSSHHRGPRQPGAGESAEGTTPNANGAGENAANLQQQLDDALEKSNTYLASWQRTAADFQNYKRRTEQEREEYALLANRALLINLLPAIDDLDRAIEQAEQQNAGAGWLEGFEAIQRKLHGALEASGVSEIPADGEPFDPNVHEAVSQGPGEHDKVIAEVRRGYRLGSRVLRPAMVVVGNGQPAEQTGADGTDGPQHGNN
ncbi:MAG TPA: nucleotide exchange factor GrpE [Dehalococcoidia bacterium]|nr:nucleotide exchange factor GrpE [Dehalococcoidia bacterium]